MNGDVSVKTKDGMNIRIPYTTITKIKLANSKPEESTKDVTKQ
jgi:ribosomal protein S3AE